MPRFSVYANAEGVGYLVDVQANLLSHLNTRMVVPLLPADRAPLPAQTLNPIFDVDGVRHVLVTQFMAAVPDRLLKTKVFDALDRSHDIIAAMDCLFQGV
jgi:toxin CcdB